MSKKFDCVSRIQLTALAFISMLSPTVQRVPGQISALSGRAGWVSALLTTIPVIITALLYS